MKKELVISIKSSSEGMSDLRKAFKSVVKRKAKGSKYEISFDNRKSFEKFAKNIYVLSSIIKFKPSSIYELAKLSGLDVSNLNKIVVFYEKMACQHTQTCTTSLSLSPLTLFIEHQLFKMSNYICSARISGDC